MSKWLFIVGLAVVVLGGGAWYASHRDQPTAGFTTAKVARQDLSATITATGTVEPEEVVDVGAQVNGQIVRFGPDKEHPDKPIDYRSNVDAGQLLAKIDDREYQFALEKAKAAVESAKSAILLAEANQTQMQAKLVQADSDWNRVEHLADKSAGISDQERDQYRAADLVARANVQVEEASVEQAKTALSQTQASLQQAQQDVDYCTITSPVGGQIIARRMNAGQTVNSSYSAPSLFLIAKDLRRMQVWASVNEADVGHIHAGQAVVFGVDAYPGQDFHGVVDKVRYDVQMTQNVVTYTVEITVDNADGKLLPYMTANVRFQLDPRRHVQVVPNAALRWVPQSDQIMVDADAGNRPVPPPPAASAVPPPAAAPPADDLRDRGTVWVQAGAGMVRPIRVRAGTTDGTVTEVAAEPGGTLADNTDVVVGETDASDGGDSGGSNPFVPQWGKKKK